MIDFLFFSFVTLNFVSAFAFSNRNLSSPLLVVFSPLVQLVLFDVLFYYIHGKPSELLEIIVCQSVLIFSFYIGMKSTAESKSSAAHRASSRFDEKKINLITKYLFGLGVLAIAAVFIRSGVSPAQLLDFKAFARFYMDSRKGGGATFHLFTYAIFFTLLLFSCRTRKPLHFVLAASLLIFTSALGGRGFILCGFSSIACSLLLLSDVKSVRYVVILGFACAVATFIGGSLLRFGGLDGYLDKVLSKDIDIYQIYESVDFAITATNWSPLGFVNDIDLLIPSAWSLNKPPSTFETLSLFPVVGEHGSNITFGLYSNALFAFGSFGIILVALFYAALGRFYRQFTAIGSQNSPATVFLFSIVFSFQLLWLRGGLFNVRLVPVLLCLLLAGSIYKIAFSASDRK